MKTNKSSFFLNLTVIIVKMKYYNKKGAKFAKNKMT